MLELIILHPPPTAGYTREIVFLTDGGISGWEEEPIYQLIAHGRASEAAPEAFPEAPAQPPGAMPRIKAAVQGGGASAGEATAAATTIYCLGIGYGVHRGLLDGMAQRSGGVAQYVVEDAQIAAKCGYLRRAALASGCLKAPRLVARGCVVKPAPAALPPVGGPTGCNVACGPAGPAALPAGPAALPALLCLP